MTCEVGHLQDPEDPSSPPICAASATPAVQNPLHILPGRRDASTFNANAPPSVLDVALDRRHEPPTIIEFGETALSPELPVRPGMDEFRLQPTRSEIPDLLDERRTYRQYYRGVPVDDSFIVIHEERGVAQRWFVRFLADLMLDVVPGVTARKAKELAQDHVHASGNTRNVGGHARLFIAAGRECLACPLQPRLVWRFFDPGPPESTLCYRVTEVNTHTGRVWGPRENCIVD